MWGKPPFEVAESFVVEVGNLEAARNWYKEKLGFRDAPNDVPDDSGKPYLALALSGDVPEIVMVEKDAKSPSGSARPIFFTGNLRKTQEWMAKRGVSAGPIEADSGGNQFFKIKDLEGNLIEVCQEPG